MTGSTAASSLLRRTADAIGSPPGDVRSRGPGHEWITIGRDAPRQRRSSRRRQVDLWQGKGAHMDQGIRTRARALIDPCGERADIGRTGSCSASAACESRWPPVHEVRFDRSFLFRPRNCPPAQDTINFAPPALPVTTLLISSERQKERRT